MSFDKFSYGVCGVFCGQCSSGNGKINELAGELIKLTSDLTTKDSYLQIKEFDTKEFRKGLDYFHKSYGCPTCLNIKEPWCEVLKCERALKLKSCLLCEDFLTCSRTDYHRDRYPYVVDHYKRVQEVGLEQLLKEEEKRAKEGVLLIDIRKW